MTLNRREGDDLSVFLQSSAGPGLLCSPALLADTDPRNSYMTALYAAGAKEILSEVVSET